MATPRPIQLRATGSRQEERTNSCTLGLQPLGSSRLPPVAGLAARSGPKLHPQVPVQVAPLAPAPVWWPTSILPQATRARAASDGKAETSKN